MNSLFSFVFPCRSITYINRFSSSDHTIKLSKFRVGGFITKYKLPKPWIIFELSSLNLKTLTLFISLKKSLHRATRPPSLPSESSYRRTMSHPIARFCIFFRFWNKGSNMIFFPSIALWSCRAVVYHVVLCERGRWIEVMVGMMVCGGGGMQ